MPPTMSRGTLTSITIDRNQSEVSGELSAEATASPQFGQAKASWAKNRSASRMVTARLIMHSDPRP